MLTGVRMEVSGGMRGDVDDVVVVGCVVAVASAAAAVVVDDDEGAEEEEGTGIERAANLQDRSYASMICLVKISI